MKRSELSILIVEDDANFCRTMTEAIKSFGFRPLAVSKVEEAIQLAKIKSIHAAVIDCVLPKMNGIDLAKEIRNTRFGKAPIFLMSGILKDQAFIQDAKNGTQALEYFKKPFDLLELKIAIDKSLSHLLEEKTVVDLKAIVAKNFQTVRQRIKVIEALENIKGWDLLLVLGVLSEARVSGQLNLVSETGDIAGITLSHGIIVKVDVPNAKNSIKKMLTDKGLIDEEDDVTLNQILDQSGKSFVQEAVTHSLLSPHLMSEVESGIIHVELEQLFLEKSFQISYASSEHSALEKTDSWENQNNYFSQLLTRRLPISYLSEFYEQWDNFSIRLGASFSENETIFQMAPYNTVRNWGTVLGSGVTINELTGQLKMEKDQIYRLIHALVVRRQLLFDDERKVKTKEELEQKIQTLHDNIVGKTAVQIFEYFGVDEDMNPEQVAKIFHDFARSNHPDQVPKEQEELKAKMNQIFSFMSEAHSILTDPVKRDAYYKNIKAKQAAKQIGAENLVQEAQQLIRKSQYFLAIGKLKESHDMYPTSDTFMQIVFCELKSAPHPLPPTLQGSIQKKLDSLRPDEKKSAYYFLNMALLAKAKSDIQSTIELLTRAIAVDGNLLEARRELATIQAQVKQRKSEDILTGDITAVFGRFFKKKGS